MKKIIGSLILSSLVLTAAPAQAELNLDELNAQMEQLMGQLKPEQLGKIGPHINNYKNCLVDQQLIDADGFNLSRLFSAKKACDPVLSEIFNAMGLESEQQRDEATQQIYRQLLNSSI